MLGYYYFKKNDLTLAERYFQNVIDSENGRSKYSAFKSLIDIYMRSNVAKLKVEKLVGLINDFDNDRLTYRSRDLEKKYKI